MTSTLNGIRTGETSLQQELAAVETRRALCEEGLNSVFGRAAIAFEDPHFALQSSTSILARIHAAVDSYLIRNRGLLKEEDFERLKFSPLSQIRPLSRERKVEIGKAILAREAEFQDRSFIALFETVCRKNAEIQNFYRIFSDFPLKEKAIALRNWMSDSYHAHLLHQVGSFTTQELDPLPGISPEIALFRLERPDILPILKLALAKGNMSTIHTLLHVKQHLLQDEEISAIQKASEQNDAGSDLLTLSDSEFISSPSIFKKIDAMRSAAREVESAKTPPEEGCILS